MRIEGDEEGGFTVNCENLSARVSGLNNLYALLGALGLSEKKVAYPISADDLHQALQASGLEDSIVEADGENTGMAP
jgi:hypothetical protein